MNKQQIEYISTANLIPYASNSRTHDTKQISQIAASIKEFGFNNPVLVDGDNGIIAGHGRVLAAQLLNLDAVPTIKLEHLTDAQKRAYIIADNKIALNAGWSHEILSMELDKLAAIDFDISTVGFDVTSSISFEPTINPIISTQEIGEQNMAQAQEKIESRIAGTEKKLMDVICPECGEEFYV